MTPGQGQTPAVRSTRSGGDEVIGMARHVYGRALSLCSPQVAVELHNGLGVAHVPRCFRFNFVVRSQPWPTREKAA
jgi:hypothetical protein